MGRIKQDILFEQLNEDCLLCKNKCKQSSKSTILYCPDFINKETNKKEKIQNDNSGLIAIRNVANDYKRNKK